MTLFNDDSPYNSQQLVKSATELYNSGVITISQMKTIRNKIKEKYGLEVETKIPFITFWDLYGKKVGDKDAIEISWNILSLKVQTLIIEVLPEWKLQFENRQFQPNPETFINHKRWNDEIIKKTHIIKPVYDNNGNGKIQGAQSILQNYQDL